MGRACGGTGGAGISGARIVAAPALVRDETSGVTVRVASAQVSSGADWLTSRDMSGGSDRRALLISAAYPPAADVGTARWEAFTPYVLDAGYGLDVVMEHPDTLDRVEWSRLENIPADVRVLGVRRTDAAWFVAAKRFLDRTRGRSNAAGGDLLHPVTEVSTAQESQAAVRPGLRDTAIEWLVRHRTQRWIDGAVASAMRILDSRHCVVISSGPPHDAHVAAAEVARRAGLPLVLDLRDPWGGTSPTTSLLDRVYADPLSVVAEAGAISAAAAVIMNTEAARRLMQSRYPDRASRVHAIPNGSDLAPIPRAAVVDTSAPFTLVHTGTLYLDRDPRPFLQAIARLVEHDGLTSRELRVVFMGLDAIIAQRPLAAWAADLGLAGIFEQRPFGARAAAQALLAEAHMTVAFQGANPTQVPGKIYEYASYPAWLMALAGHDSATAEVLAGSSAIIHDLSDIDAIEASLHRCIAAHRRGEQPDAVNADGRFSRSRQAQSLTAILDTVAAPRSQQKDRR
jgi:glycosyltransferase involved in cell wall biosynthesis